MAGKNKEEVTAFYQKELFGQMVNDIEKPKYQFTVRNGVLDGTYKEWWSNGNLRYVINYKSDGKVAIRHGKFVSYTIDGKVGSTRKYIEGKLVSCR